MSGGAGLSEALLAVALLIIVPLGVRLHRDLGARWTLLLLGPGVLAAAALLVARGWLAAAMAVPWLIVTVVAAGVSAWAWLQGRRVLLDLAWVAAPAYLAFGAAWLVFDRMGLEPAGVTPPFVLLTSVHFHYAGFVAALLVSLVRTRVASQAVVVPMILAVQWAVGWNYGTPALSIPAMARTHGVLNAVGFSLCGVLGWLRLRSAEARS